MAVQYRLVYFWLIILSFYPQLSRGQHFIHLSSEEGLSQNSVLSIAQDSIGFIWMGTQLGIDRFDGSQVIPYLLRDTANTAFVTKISSDNSGNIWAQRGNELRHIFYDEEEFDFTDSAVVSISDSLELKDFSVWDDGKILALCRKDSTLELRIFELGKLVTIPVSKKIEHLTIHRESGFLFGTSQNSVYYTRLQSLKDWNKVDLLTDVQDPIMIPSGIEGTILVAYHDKERVFAGISSISLDDVTISKEVDIEPILDQLEIAKPSITSSTEFGGEILIGTSSMGVLSLNSDRISIKFQKDFSSDYGLCSNLISSLFTSDDGVVWIGSDGRGADVYSPYIQTFEHIFKDHDCGDIPCNNDNWSIYQDSDSIVFIGTDHNGLLSYDLGDPTKSTFSRSNFFKGTNVIKSIDSYNGSLFIGTNNGVYTMDLMEMEFKTRLPTFLRDEKINVLKIFGDILLIGTEEGLYEVELSSTQPSIRTICSQHKIKSITRDKQDEIYWLGTNYGIFHYNPIIDSVFRPSEFKSFNQVVQCIYQRGPEYWFGTRNGVYFYDGYNVKSRYLGLPSPIVYGIVEDRFKSLWISTNKGIVRHSSELETSNVYDFHYGLQHEEFNTGSYFHYKRNTSEEIIYFGGVNGVNRFSPINPVDVERKGKQVLYLRYPGTSKDFKIILNTKDIELPLGSLANAVSIKAQTLNYRDFLNNEISYDSPDTIIFSSSYVELTNLREKPQEEDFSIKIGLKSSNRWMDSGVEYDFATNETILIKWQELDIYTQLLTLSPIIVAVVLLLLRVARVLERSRQKYILDLQDNINKVSRMESIQSVLDKSLDILTDKRFSGFDMGRILLVDYIKREINVGATSLTFPKNKFFHDQNRLYKIKGLESKSSWNNVGVGVQIEAIAGRSKIIENRGFLRKKYQGYEKIIFPIINRSKRQTYHYNTSNPEVVESNDYVIGLVELVRPRSLYFIARELYKLIGLRPLWERNLILFIDNIAQPYIRAKKEHRRSELDKFFQDVEQDLIRTGNQDSPDEFSRLVIDKLAQITSSDAGDITQLHSGNADWEHTHPITTTNIDSEKLRSMRMAAFAENRGITKYVFDTYQAYYTGNTSEDEYFYNSIIDEQSQITIPISLKLIRKKEAQRKKRVSLNLIEANNIEVIISLYSQRNHHFDEFRLDYISRIGRIYQEQYITLITNRQQEELVDPFNVFGDIYEELYRPSREIIERKFFSNHVGIWLESNENFVIEDCSLGLKELLNEFKRNSLSFKVVSKVNRTKIHLIETIVEENPELSILKKRSFECALIIPLTVGVKKFGLITVLLNKSIRLSESDEKFLRQLAQKISLARQMHLLQNFFVDIASSIKEGNSMKMYKELAMQACKILYADSVVIFRYDNAKKIIDTPAAYSGKVTSKSEKFFNNVDSTNSFLINLIESKQSIRFFPENQGEDVKSSNLAKGGSFRERENIKSSAVCKIGDGKERIGLVFLNYKQEKDLKHMEKFIVAFAQMAGIAISGSQNFQKVRNEYARLEELKEEIDYKYVEVEERMTQMVPMVTRTSFYEILRAVNHDIRNFILNVQVFNKHFREELLDKGKVTDKAKVALKNRIETTDLTLDNITNLLELFDFRAKNVEELDVAKIIKEVVAFFQLSEDIIFNLNLSVGSNYVFFNKAEFSMILYNLINNAVWAVKHKGHGNNDFKGEIKVDVNRVQGEVHILIEDNGVGIQREHIEKVFEAGFTTKKEGIGIGLFFVRSIMEENGGRVRAQSQYKKWTKFFLEFNEA